MVVCTNATKPLELEDIPELRRWSDEFGYRFGDTVKFRITGQPVPPFPESKDYFQFCDVMERDPNAEDALMMFRELFDLDSEDNIIGASMVYSSGKFRSALEDGHSVDILIRFEAAQRENWSVKYDRIFPWVEDVLRDMAGPRPEDDCALEQSSYGLPVTLIVGVCDDGMGVYGFYHWDNLVQEAVKYNFSEGDPDRALLMESTKILSRNPPTETLRWFRYGLDYSRTFDSELLVRFKPPLLAYLEDLKNLAGDNDNS